MESITKKDVRTKKAFFLQSLPQIYFMIIVLDMPRKDVAEILYQNYGVDLRGKKKNGHQLMNYLDTYGNLPEAKEAFSYYKKTQSPREPHDDWWLRIKGDVFDKELFTKKDVLGLFSE